jgi:hypothetical protein
LILVSKYKALRAIANFCQFVAVPVAILYVLSAFFLFKAESSLDVPLAVVEAAGLVVAGVFSMVVLWAAAEAIRVFIDIEENTRAVRQIMEHEFRGKYQTSTPTTEALRVSAETPNHSPQSSSQVRFGGTSS